MKTNDEIGASMEPLRKPAAAPQAVQAAVPEAIEQMAVDRYKVVPSHESMFHRWAVVAGNGTQQLYIGREVECLNMARKFAGAFLDGAFVAMQNTTPARPAEGVPAQAVIEALDRMDALLQPGLGLLSVGDNSATANASRADMATIRAALAATQPAAQGMDRQKIDPLRQMLAQHEAHLEQNPYAYFELAYTRRTGWMVWITDKPAFRESVLVNPDRKVLWQGQGDTPDEACENAALAAQAKQGGA